MNILLDTHAFIWLISDKTKLSLRAKKYIQSNCDQLFISVISFLEIALLCKRGKLTLPLPCDIYIERALKSHGLIEKELDRKILIESANLPDIHNDPFDRMIISTSKIHSMTIISKDSKIKQYPHTKVIW